jgi:hypothetical protein|uniref:Uncharacterized protein n=1 Tax=viral metagenome TaxID=1070528 RepID=A0A6C0HBP6_9ZZZZ
MNDIIDNLFSPLGKEYCQFFYYLSVLGFIFMAIVLLLGLFIGITKKKGVSFYLKMLSLAFGYGIFYFQNRLLYTMCNK